MSQKTALILSGGGARAAYQVGVLKGISTLMREGASSPFRILCGTSAGAINAAALAATKVTAPSAHGSAETCGAAHRGGVRAQQQDGKPAGLECHEPAA